MRAAILALVIATLLAPAGRAQDFDYYVLSLSWSPTWCENTGDPDAEQCAPDRDLGFVLHGLWPQFEDGYPEYCSTPRRDPARRQTAAMADVMGSGGLAWHQWKKHGRCTGLEAADYFTLSSLAYGLVTLPEMDARMAPADIEDAFLEANPELSPDALVVTCRSGLLQEVRICLTTGLGPRFCGDDVLRGVCRAKGQIDVPGPP